MQPRLFFTLLLHSATFCRDRPDAPTDVQRLLLLSLQVLAIKHSSPSVWLHWRMVMQSHAPPRKWSMQQVAKDRELASCSLVCCAVRPRAVYFQITLPLLCTFTITGNVALKRAS